MKVGDYVRTDDGFIGKITSIESNERIHLFQKSISTDNYKWLDLVLEENIIKSSPNIIDLIEVGDYVNGKKVVDKQYHYTDKDNYDIGEWCIFYENVALGDYQYNIKSVVTKEMYSSVEYRVEIN